MFADEFPDHLDGFRRVFDSSDPHRYVTANIQWGQLSFTDYALVVAMYKSPNTMLYNPYNPIWVSIYTVCKYIWAQILA